MGGASTIPQTGQTTTPQTGQTTTPQTGQTTLQSSATLDAATCVQVVIESTGRTTYYCRVSEDNTMKNINKDGWRATNIIVQGGSWPCRSYIYW